ncbi:cobaltochelatase subunit CobN [Falsigemmobacter faecalis]|uniref:Cobaltochelatase subunit CobN n=1 Tax=Falsigemmobacter faecalis TaxID=2488730 RepID=A0A3P3DCL1_9RHOB|nr:cobaltochelatase subunit CobN [Falsigemmobacter faecalis]RRH72067.1 cobaltochelatase subunit CobN [Falsigemmobacter faecalis]
MHVLFRESHGLEETVLPEDLKQEPADLVVLSFSDSDLGAFAAGWRRGLAALPSLRLASLSRLRHPLSVDTYVDQTLMHAKGVLVRLIGGKSYWPYGVEELSRIARARGIALAFLPADGLPDPVLEAASTLPVATLRRLTQLCDAGGEIAAQAALAQLALASGLYAGPVPGLKTLPDFGFWHPNHGPLQSFRPIPGQDLVVIPFYRAWATAADTEAVAALIRGFEAAGLAAIGLFVPSLKDASAAEWLKAVLADLRPAAIVNTTAFSARSNGASPLDAADVPVFQAIHATAPHAAWAGTERGLSAADLAMHIALPEVDGRLNGGVISFKELQQPDPDLQYALQRHCPDPERIAALVSRVTNWISLQRPDTRPVALVLSTYPGKEWRLAHAVGLDALASAAAICEDLGQQISDDQLLQGLQQSRLDWPDGSWARAVALLPDALRGGLDLPVTPPRIRAFWQGNLLISLQPERGDRATREASYHDLSAQPSVEYIAFYLWLRVVAQVRALIHIGAHGTLEWLPGKAVALSDSCWPEALTGGLPVIYPFIVNDPGEAAQARRRLGAVTLGHLPPPLVDAGLPQNLARLEALLDEYATADGLDPARRLRLIPAIRQEAQREGLEADLGLAPNASPAEAITTIDRFVCDLKESQFGDGLHIWGRGTPDPDGQPQGEAASLLAERRSIPDALQGRWIAPGPSGSPWKGRSDVLPTGRNLYGIDPRAVPSRTAWAQGVRLAEEFVRRHLQDYGDYPKAVLLNLWGSATMRTSGEDFAMALHLAGLKPLWDPQTERVTGFEITPYTLMDRPRIDVTLRVSGLFRDTFPELATLFEAGCAALAARDEAADVNPYTAAPPGPRVFAPAPGRYGTGIDEAMDRDTAGQAWLQNSCYDALGRPDPAALEQRVRAAEAFVLSQDLAETDLLLAMDYAAHEGGFAAARHALGLQPLAMLHLDATRPDRPRARALSEEIARVLRARAASPVWLAGMMRHKFRGAAEIAATLEHMAAFARLADAVPAHLFELYRSATLGTPEVAQFLRDENPAALARMEAIFVEFDPHDLRRNSRGPRT